MGSKSSQPGSRSIWCAACGWTPRAVAADPYPFRCPNAGTDDGDHLITVRGGRSLPPDLHGEPTASLNPFIRYRSRLYSWCVALENGLTDADYVAVVEELDAAVAGVCGHAFRVTPFGRSAPLSDALRFRPEGGVWVKDETGNVSGSHKGRHLMGVALYLRVLERLGMGDPDRPLAVASCGNAALGAAVVARALGRRLLVFVPDHAASAVVVQLEHLGACVTRCARRAEVAGDPSYLAFRDAVSQGALAFTCQGNENGLAIEGASTIAWEMLEAWPREGEKERSTALAGPDRVFIQTGGGALASACARAFTEAVDEGWLKSMPKLHPVQTTGGYPLKRAYERLLQRAFGQLAPVLPVVRAGFANDGDRARYLLHTAPPSVLDETFAYARAHRSSFMWPWEREPRSIAGGILDDETYDWAAVLEATVRSGGFPVVVDEATLAEANDAARVSTGVRVCHTGSAGLAGLLDRAHSLDKPSASERVVALFTGLQRSARDEATASGWAR